MDGTKNDVYEELYYHFVWATKGRAPLIVPAIEARLHGYIRRQCLSLGVEVYALNGMTDHVHLACALPTRHSIADFMHKVKGSSWHFINHLPDVQGDVRLCLYWQPGYGALTYTKNELPRVASYVDNQKTHHRTGRMWEKMERITNPP